MTYNELNLTDEQVNNVLAMVGNLQVQANMFDMGIDYELMTLSPIKSPEPDWLLRWKDKENNKDKEEPEW